VQGFSAPVRDSFERFAFHAQIDKLEKAGLLYLVTEKFAGIDLHPDTVSNAQMGAVFEELIRKFAELSNETAGEHFTPREVIRLMVNLLFIEDDDALTKPGVVRSLYDPTAGTGGMLSVAGEHLAGINPDARLVMYGKERRRVVHHPQGACPRAVPRVQRPVMPRDALVYSRYSMPILERTRCQPHCSLPPRPSIGLRPCSTSSGLGSRWATTEVGSAPRWSCTPARRKGRRQLS
jgi:hypothetical protein